MSSDVGDAAERLMNAYGPDDPELLAAASRAFYRESRNQYGAIEVAAEADEDMKHAVLALVTLRAILDKRDSSSTAVHKFLHRE